MNDNARIIELLTTAIDTIKKSEVPVIKKISEPATSLDLDLVDKVSSLVKPEELVAEIIEPLLNWVYSEDQKMKISNLFDHTFFNKPRLVVANGYKFIITPSITEPTKHSIVGFTSNDNNVFLIAKGRIRKYEWSLKRLNPSDPITYGDSIIARAIEAVEFIPTPLPNGSRPWDIADIVLLESLAKTIRPEIPYVALRTLLECVVPPSITHDLTRTWRSPLGIPLIVVSDNHNFQAPKLFKLEDDLQVLIYQTPDKGDNTQYVIGFNASNGMLVYSAHGYFTQSAWFIQPTTLDDALITLTEHMQAAIRLAQLPGGRPSDVITTVNKGNLYHLKP